MADFPAMPLWTDAYLADTRHLSHAEHGRYLLMIMDIWRMPEKRFPNDDAWLARKFGCSIDDVAKLWRPLIAEFFANNGNWITHKRVEREWARLRGTSARQSAAAKSGWKKRRESSMIAPDDILNEHATENTNPLPRRKNAPSHGNAALALQPQPQPEDSSESVSNATDISSKPEHGTNIVASDKPKRRLAYPEEFEVFWDVYPQRPTDTKRLAFLAWQKTVKSGVDPPILQAGAERYAAFVRRTGHESMLVATWCSDNRQGWTASYAGNSGNGHGKSGIVERVASRLRAEGKDLFGSDGPLVEGRPSGWRNNGH